MKFSYNWLKEHIEGEIPKPKKLAELLTLHSFEVEGVEKILSDFLLNIDVLPNRAADCFSHIGIARECAAILNVKCKSPEVKLSEDKKLKAKDFVKIKVKNKQDCSRYTVRVFIDVKVRPSPQWMKKRLKVCGLRPINNIVDIANYVMLETGQPLHAFDLDKVANQKIIVRRAKRGEKIITLDNEKYDLDKEVLVIADPKGSLGIAGIKGGGRAEIDKKTKRVVLESANFNSKVIRQGSQKINLKTDASWRFEHGIDPNLTEMAANRAAVLIREVAGGKIAQGLVDFYPKRVLPRRVKLDLGYVEKLLGVKIPEKKIKNILQRLGFKTSEQAPRKIVVEVPTWRLDISLAEDLIEEIGRIAGFEKIPAKFPLAVLTPSQRNLNIFWEGLTKNILKAAGFSEVYNYSFINERDAETFSYKVKRKSVLVELENPISVEQKYLRPSLIPNLLKNIQKNQKYFDQIKIFELGKVFKIKSKKQKTPNYQEKRVLAGVITGDAFYQLKGVVDLLLNKLGISNIWYDSYQPTPEESKREIWHPKKCAEIKVNHQELGFLGEIKPSLLGNLKIEKKAVVFDLDFEKLQKLSSEEQEYRPISRYPAAIRDLAILVPKEIRVVEVLNEINTAGGGIIKDIDLFDIYEGVEIPSGKKSLAFHIIYQSSKKTLKSEEVDKIHQKIIKALQINPEWQVRQ